MTVQHARDWLSIHADAAETAEGLAAFYDKRPVDYEMLRQNIIEGGTKCAHCGAVDASRLYASAANVGTHLSSGD